MNEIVMKKHDFELAKNRLKEFSEKEVAELEIDKVTDSGFLGFGDHKVTGSELNDRIATIQKILIDINGTNIKTIEEFGEIYKALDALDKDYIASIIASVKAIEKTSNDVRSQQKKLNKHNSKLNEQQNKLDSHQGEIDKIVDNIHKAVSVLKSFKEKLDNFKHLNDIDEIWMECQAIHNEIQDISENAQESAKKANVIEKALTVIEKKIEDIFNQSSVLIKTMESISTFTSELEQIAHLKDIDEMWNCLTQAHDAVQNISAELGLIKDISCKHQENIDDLLTFMKQISELKHLMDVDTIWNRTEEHTDRLNGLAEKNERLLKSIDTTKDDVKCLNEYKSKLSKLAHLEDIDSVWTAVEKQSNQLSSLESQHIDIISVVQNNKESSEMALVNAIEQSNTTIKILENKIKYAYLIAGGSAGLAIIELIVLLMKVI